MSVSVVMTCHNEERYIEQAIRSVVEQTLFNKVVEIIVVNDGSRDYSQSLLEQLAGKFEKLKVITSAGLGLPAARNLALRLIQGDFVAILDGDDYWVREKLEQQLPVFNRDERIGLVYSDFIDFSHDDASDARMITVRRFNPDSSGQFRDYFINDAPIVPSTVIVRREALNDVGLFDENLRIGEDTEFYLRVAEKWRFSHVPGGFTFKRRRAGQITQRLDVLLSTADLVTRRFCERHPELKPLAGRRMARYHTKASIDCVLRGEWRTAFHYTLCAISLAPFYGRAWASLLLLLAPASVIRPLYNGLKKPWHALRKMQYGDSE